MLLRQLEYLAALSREEHFARAAAACHVTQPALSAGIRRLEQELGVQIVRRGQRFEGFTLEGEEVLRWGKRMLAERDALDQTLSSMRGGLVGTMRIGAIPTVLPVSSLLTTPLHRRHPGIQFVLESMTSREIAMRLNDFDIDVGMTYVDGEPLGRVRVVPLYEERYLFLTPAEGAFGNRTSLTWAEAAGTPLVQLTSGMQNRRIVDELLADTGVESHVTVETDTVAAIYAHVTVMGLSSVVPHTWLPNFGVPDRTRVIPLPRPPRAYRVGLVLAGHGPEPMLARALVETARSVDIDHEVDQLMAGLWRSATPPSIEPGY
ncbi:LysR family transcriptional regulator [Nocardioides sp. BGMRC 2183]|nr:LysR family transcriptional regulator [Nocardioides sp. BGMRC 2183]